jgi:cold-inducible RNA-binding protein
MADEQAAANAIAGLNGKDLDGRALNVNEAKPKPARPSGGGRGYGGGGGYNGGGRSSEGGGQRDRW